MIKSSIEPDQPILTLEHVDAGYGSQRGNGGVLRDFSMEIYPGECLGLVGESGSGKSTVARVITGLLNPDAGMVRFGGERIDHLKWRRRLEKTARGIQMVFQNPYSSFDPRQTVGSQLEEALLIQKQMNRTACREGAMRVLRRVGLSESYYDRYPGALSGGQLQRVALGCALIVHPALLIADEPVSALDVSVQAQILDLLRALRAEFSFSSLFISHDLHVIYYLCDRVAVLREGRIVEIGPVEQVYQHPEHPYTRRLIGRAMGSTGELAVD